MREIKGLPGLQNICSRAKRVRNGFPEGNSLN